MQFLSLLLLLTFSPLPLIHGAANNAIRRPDSGLTYIELLSLPTESFLNSDGFYQPIFSWYSDKHQCDPKNFQFWSKMTTKGNLWQATMVNGKQLVVIKLFQQQTYQSRPRKILNEEVILNKLDHPNLPKGICTFANGDGSVGIVMMMIDGHNLEAWRKDHPPDYPLNLRLVMKQVAKALIYLHKRGIIHNDVKPENIIVQRDGHVFLIDFDLSVYGPEGSGVRVGTPLYAAPEKLLGNWYWDAADWYALGVTLYTMITKVQPFAKSKDMYELTKHAQCGVPKLENDPIANDLIQKLTCKDWSNRYAYCNKRSKEILNHEYFMDGTPLS